MWDRRVLWLLGVGAALSWIYRIALRRLDEDLSGWLAFVTLWLPTAIVLGLLVAYAMPAISRWLSGRRGWRR